MVIGEAGCGQMFCWHTDVSIAALKTEWVAVASVACKTDATDAAASVVVANTELLNMYCSDVQVTELWNETPEALTDIGHWVLCSMSTRDGPNVRL